jgi:hypothetical protein
VPHKDLQQVDAVCRRFGMTVRQAIRFKELIHELKDDGHCGTANERGDFTWRELLDIAADFMAGE